MSAANGRSSHGGRSDHLGLAGRMAVAAVVSAFTLSGVAALREGVGSHRPGVEIFMFPFGAWVGAIAARAVVKDAQHVRMAPVAVLAFAGAWYGFVSRPSYLWFPPARNLAWVAAWTFAAALLGTLWRRSVPKPPEQGWSILARVLVVVYLFFVVWAI